MGSHTCKIFCWRSISLQADSMASKSSWIIHHRLMDLRIPAKSDRSKSYLWSRFTICFCVVSPEPVCIPCSHAVIPRVLKMLVCNAAHCSIGPLSCPSIHWESIMIVLASIPTVYDTFVSAIVHLHQGGSWWDRNQSWSICQKNTVLECLL